MSSISTTWSSDSNTKANATSTTNENVSLGGTLSVAGDTTLSGALSLSGNLTLGNNETILNVTDDTVRIGSNDSIIKLDIATGSSDSDSMIRFLEGATGKWYLGNDAIGAASGDLFTIGTGATMATNVKMSLNTSGNLTTSGYIVEGRTVIKVPAHHFLINNDVGQVARLEDDGSNYGYRAGNSATEFYAFVDVPLGYTATKVRIYGSDTSNEVEVYTFDVTDGTIGSEISNSGLTVDDDTSLASNHVGSNTNMLMIKVAVAATDDLIYSGIVTIQPS
tara:strand:- start:283 stop:1116 length:834 start_codon:yes stop_codon:yes gene_type:complete